MYIYIYILNIHFFFSLPSGDRPEGCNGGWWWRCDRGTQLPINNNRRRLLLLELSARIPSVGTESCHGKEKNNNAAIEWGRIRNRTNERKYRRKKKIRQQPVPRREKMFFKQICWCFRFVWNAVSSDAPRCNVWEPVQPSSNNAYPVQNILIESDLYFLINI